MTQQLVAGFVVAKCCLLVLCALAQTIFCCLCLVLLLSLHKSLFLSLFLLLLQQSPQEGEIVEFKAKDGDPVEYGECYFVCCNSNVPVTNQPLSGNACSCKQHKST